MLSAISVIALVFPGTICIQSVVSLFYLCFLSAFWDFIMFPIITNSPDVATCYIQVFLNHRLICFLIPQWIRSLIVKVREKVEGYTHIHTWVFFLLWLHPFILSGVISHWSPVAYWALTDLGSFSLSILSFCLFILFMGFSRQEYWSGLPFPSPVGHILSVWV